MFRLLSRPYGIALGLFVSTLFSVAFPAELPTASPKKPNIIFILADDMGIGDLGCYGQTKIKTPVLDRMADEGIKFTQGYSGCAVCAPSRASLITGLNTGHCPIRGNYPIGKEGQLPLPEGTDTIASQLKSCGYATMCAGKWGMGMFDTSGSPLKKGFDNFYGYNCQKHAHSYFPNYLYENDKRVELDGKTYSPNFIVRHTLSWILAHKEEPFFVFYSTTLPHGAYEIDDLGEYKNENWTEQQKTYAAMCTRLDTEIGMMLDLLKELNLDENTIVFFAGDNGSAFGEDSKPFAFFNPNNGLRGTKRSLYEGGLRQAFLARWPKRISPGTVCDTPIAFWDMLPTCMDLAGSTLPENVPTNGVSLEPLLLRGKAPDRDAFYWEIHEHARSRQAVRWKDWKFVRNGLSKPIELYDLKTDPGEKEDLAVKMPDLVRKGEEMLKTMRTENPIFTLKD